MNKRSLIEVEAHSTIVSNFLYCLVRTPSFLGCQMAESTERTGGKKLKVAPSKTLSLKGREVEAVVRQSFTHGRTKAIVVEKVKSRIPTRTDTVQRFIDERKTKDFERRASYSAAEVDAAYEEAVHRVESARQSGESGLFLADLSALDRIPPLKGLAKLRGINLAGTLVSDLSPLAELPRLTGVNLNDTLVSDLTPLGALKKIRFLRIADTQISDLSPLADLTTLVTGAMASYGVEFEDTFIEDLDLRNIARGENPNSTLKAISYVRAKAGLPAIDMVELHRRDAEDWAERVSQLRQAPLGARFVQRDDVLSIDPSGDESDEAAAAEPVINQLHDGVRRKAKEFVEPAKRVGNQRGWEGLGETAERFSNAIACKTSDIPAQIGTVYESIIALGSFLDLDARLRKSPAASNADPLDLEIQRQFTDLIRTAAPWVRRFPTARMLDDETGAFLTRTDLYEPAAQIIKVAETSQVITTEDARLLQTIIEAARRGEFQGQKAAARSVWSSKNLVTALGIVLSLEVGMVGNEAASKSIIAQRGAQFYLSAEDYVMKLFEDAPEDIKQALKAMIDDLRKNSGGDPANVPDRPRQRRLDDRVRQRDDIAE